MKAKAKNITLIIILVAIAAIVGVLLYINKKKGETGDETGDETETETETETKLPLLQAQLLDDSLQQAFRDRWSATHNTTGDNNDDENNNDAEVDIIPVSHQPLTTKGNDIDTFVQLTKGHNFFIGR